MRVRIAFHSPASGGMEIYPESTNDVIRVKMWPVGQRDDHVWGISQGKAKGKVDVYPDCGLRLDVSTKLKKTYIGFFKVWWGYDFVYWFMPFFDKSRGLYDHKQVTVGSSGIAVSSSPSFVGAFALRLSVTFLIIPE